ncbi:MAG: choline-sulfatase [Opitutaceae bacterium]|nr:choline-sulfatase [Opitutaceae bacterium]
MEKNTQSDQPNIILIQADQMASFVLPFCNPAGQAITPNLSKLAEEGVLLNNAYSNSPLCCPARACMFTGLQPSSTEVWGNGSEFRSSLPTMMHYLRHAGYRSVVSGKTHFIGADQLHGFDKRLTTDMYPSDFSWSIDWKPNVEHRIGTSVKKLEVSGLCRTNNQILFDTEVQYRTIEYLRYEAMEPKESPFFLHVSFTQPHEAYQSVPKFWDQYENVDIELPSQSEDTEDDMHPVTRWLKIHHGIDQHPPSKETVRDSRRAYYAMITQIDEYVGEIVTELKTMDLYDDTVIIFTSDHGDMMGERGMWYKRTFYEGSVKVPMIVHNPKRYTPKKTDAIVSLADLCPTLADMGGNGKEAIRYGKNESHSFLGVIKGESSEWKDEAIMEYFGPGVEEPWLCIRKGPYKYVYTRNHDPLLFNVVEDPSETVNLCNEEEHLERVGALHSALMRDINIEATTEKAAESKQTRLFLHDALKGSEGYHWDYDPDFDATKRYVRGPNMPSTV